MEIYGKPLFLVCAHEQVSSVDFLSFQSANRIVSIFLRAFNFFYCPALPLCIVIHTEHFSPWTLVAIFPQKKLLRHTWKSDISSISSSLCSLISALLLLPSFVFYSPLSILAQQQWELSIFLFIFSISLLLFPAFFLRFCSDRHSIKLDRYRFFCF